MPQVYWTICVGQGTGDKNLALHGVALRRGSVFWMLVDRPSSFDGKKAIILNKVNCNHQVCFGRQGLRVGLSKATAPEITSRALFLNFQRTLHFGPWFGLEFCLPVWRRLHLGSVKILNQDAALGRYADNLLAANAHRIHGEIARSTGFKEEWHALHTIVCASAEHVI